MTTLAGKIAVVTGAGRGIGRGIALALARHGCDVALVGRKAAALGEVAAEVRAGGRRALVLAIDLGSADAATAIVERTTVELGPIDFLVNNAAVLLPADVLDATPDDWDATMNVNLRSVFLLSQAVLRSMVARRTGYIINISSTVAHGVKAEVAAYGVSKCGLSGLSQALYASGQPHGVRVSTIYPGVTDTPMVRDLNGDNAVGSPDQWMLPDDIAYCVLFLLQQSPRMIVKEITPWAVGYDRI